MSLKIDLKKEKEYSIPFIRTIQGITIVKARSRDEAEEKCANGDIEDIDEGDSNTEYDYFSIEEC